MEVSLHLQAPDVESGKILVRIPLKIASRAGVPLSAKDILASDASGSLTLTEVDEAPTSSATFRDFIPQRSTQGDVELHYLARPLEATAHTPNGPLFDFRAQPGGANGPAVAFLTLPLADSPCRIKLHWDLSAMPKGCRGVSSLGDGDVDTVGNVNLLASSFFYVGSIDSVDQGDRFSMYWMSRPPFDIQALARQTAKFYDYASSFFGASRGAAYRVFVRENPFPGTGGTALYKSFVFGYDAQKPPTIDNLRGLIAHEVTHNWPQLEGEHGETAWYNEGTAEYYSLRLLWRAGVIDARTYVEELDKRIEAYLSNPLQNLSNEAVEKAFFTDFRTQRVPYGRGLLYLIATDGRIRKATNGKKSLDDVVRAVLQEQQGGKHVGVPEWLAMVGAIIGLDLARSDLEAMASGRAIAVVDGSLGSDFRPVKRVTHVFELGFATSSFGERVVRGLVPNSNAEKAGVREGDEIVKSSDLYSATAPEARFRMTLRRDGRLFDVEYLPREQEPKSIDVWQHSSAIGAQRGTR